MRRRDVLRVAAGAIAAPALLRGSTARAALPAFPQVAETDALLLTPTDSRYAAYLPAFNERTMKRPQLRAMCRTAKGVAAMVNWVRDNAMPFAVRSGGHCYEGFGESESVVIDTRMLDRITFDPQRRVVTAGAGSSLGGIYTALKSSGLAFAAGSCPTVGVSGHMLGGGFGFLARPYGLSCDFLRSIQLVDATGTVVTADANQNPDLFWASRGGGGGTFGVATQFQIGLVPLSDVVVFAVTWRLPVARAVRVFGAWQAWAPQAPRQITSFCRVTKIREGEIELHCAGQLTGTAKALRTELVHLTSVENPSTAVTVTPMSFFGAVNHFSGGWNYQSAFMKGKSDYVTAPMSDHGIETLMGPLLTESITIVCDSYGGAIASVAASDTAFAHRAGTLFAMQYVTTWEHAAQTAARLAEMRLLYAAMRPFVSGGAYVNYCDLDLADWPNAYWGPNLPRLKSIKAAVDPQNLFAHAQSVR